MSEQNRSTEGVIFLTRASGRICHQVLDNVLVGGERVLRWFRGTLREPGL